MRLPERLLPALCLAALLFAPACGGSGFWPDLWGDPPETYRPPPPADNSPAGLMAAGQYGAAYSALQPALQRGEPEAVFYALTIRKNGLDGRAADPAELRLLWEVLRLRAETMRQSLRDPNLPEAAKNARRTALAQLTYFSGTGPGWPPAPPADPAARGRALDEALRYLSAALTDFTPAMNFMAYLYLEPDFQAPGQAYAAALTSAGRGDFLAMGNLAWLLREGIGAPKDNLQAAHWARRGARSTPPVPRNQNEMGHVYEAGLGVTIDLAEAARWYELSAAQGHPPGAANAQRLKDEKRGPAVLDNAMLF